MKFILSFLGVIFLANSFCLASNVDCLKALNQSSEFKNKINILSDDGRIFSVKDYPLVGRIYINTPNGVYNLATKSLSCQTAPKSSVGDETMGIFSLLGTISGVGLMKDKPKAGTDIKAINKACDAIFKKHGYPAASGIGLAPGMGEEGAK